MYHEYEYAPAVALDNVRKAAHYGLTQLFHLRMAWDASLDILLYLIIKICLWQPGLLLQLTFFEGD